MDHDILLDKASGVVWCHEVPLMRGSVHSFHLALNLSALVLLLHRGRRYSAAYPRVRSLGRSYISL